MYYYFSFTNVITDVNMRVRAIIYESTPTLYLIAQMGYAILQPLCACKDSDSTYLYRRYI